MIEAILFLLAGALLGALVMHIAIRKDLKERQSLPGKWESVTPTPVTPPYIFHPNTLSMDLSIQTEAVLKAASEDCQRCLDTEYPERNCEWAYKRLMEIQAEMNRRAVAKLRHVGE